jgi:uncharacterized small protein (DUF1192 family)
MNYRLEATLSKTRFIKDIVEMWFIGADFSHLSVPDLNDSIAITRDMLKELEEERSRREASNISQQK